MTYVLLCCLLLAQCLGSDSKLIVFSDCKAAALPTDDVIIPPPAAAQTGSEEPTNFSLSTFSARRRRRGGRRRKMADSTSSTFDSSSSNNSSSLSLRDLAWAGKTHPFHLVRLGCSHEEKLTGPVLMLVHKLNNKLHRNDQKTHIIQQGLTCFTASLVNNHYCW